MAIEAFNGTDWSTSSKIEVRPQDSSTKESVSLASVERDAAYSKTYTNFTSSDNDYSGRTSDDEKALASNTDTDALTAAKSTGTNNRDFDGLNDAINRVVVKLNALTKEINGEDNINARPVTLDRIRDNIETIIKEVFYESYTDDGKSGSDKFFKKSKLSRIDELANKLYSYHLTVEGKKNVNASKGSSSTTSAGLTKKGKYKETGRTFNGKKVHGDAAATNNDSTVKEIKSYSPETIDDFSYATIIDIIVDLLSENEKDLVRGNTAIVTLSNAKVNDGSITNEDIAGAASNRLSETVLRRLDNIEAALDLVSLRFRNRKTFENDDKTRKTANYAYRNVNSIDDLMDWISLYSGIKVAGTLQDDDKTSSASFLVDPATDTTAAEAYLNKTQSAYTHNAMYDICSRVIATELDWKKLQDSLGSDYSIVEADPGKIQAAALNTVADASNDASANAKGGLVGEDLLALLRTVYGYDGTGNIAHDHFASNKAVTDFANSRNALETLYKIIFNLPERLNDSKATVSTGVEAFDVSHSSPGAQKYYNISNPQQGQYADGSTAASSSILNANGHRDKFVSLSRKNRFSVIEDAVNAIRSMLFGATGAANKSFLDGSLTLTTETKRAANVPATYAGTVNTIKTINGLDFSGNDAFQTNAAVFVLQIAVRAYNNLLLEKNLRDYQQSDHESRISANESKVSTNENAISTLNSKVSTNENAISTLNSKVSTNENAISTLNGSSTVEGSVAHTVATEIAKVVAGADKSFDTLKEISDWINTHSSSAAAMNSAISANTANIATNTAKISTNTDKISKLESSKNDKITVTEVGSSLNDDNTFITIDTVSNPTSAKRWKLSILWNYINSKIMIPSIKVDSSTGAITDRSGKSIEANVFSFATSASIGTLDTLSGQDAGTYMLSLDGYIPKVATVKESKGEKSYS